MKKVNLVSFLIVLSSFSSYSQIIDTVIQVQANLVDTTFDYFAKKDGDRIYYITISLVNKTDSQIDFCIYSCSSAGSFVFNSKYMRLIGDDCDARSIVTLKLKPGQPFIFHYLLVKNINYQRLIPKDARIGFVLIKDSEFSDEIEYDLLLERRRQDEKFIVWSQPLQFPK
jgi:hypothetical protein